MSFSHLQNYILKRQHGQFVCISLCTIVLLLTNAKAYGQSDDHEHEHLHDVFEISWKKDIPIMGAGVAFTILGDHLLRKADPASISEINLLNPADLWSIDRKATDNFSQTAKTTSDLILYSAAAIPFTLLAYNEAKGQEVELLVMTVETFLINNGITNIVKGTTQRYRPYNYNPDVTDDVKLGKTSRQSFFSGHASNTSAFCFMAARALNDMHPHWHGRKYLTWGIAASLPLAISYGRYKAGKHFTTDVVTGYLFGAGVGLLIPKLHKSDHTSINVGPGGLSLSITF